MGGAIEVQSRLGQGSVFSFTVPLERAPEPAGTRQRFEGLHALVADDHAPTRLVLRELLESWGVTVLVADSLEAALRALEQPPGAPVTLGARRVAFFDATMVGMDALATAAALKSLCKGKILCVRLGEADRPVSDFPHQGDIFAELLVKPVKRAAVAAALASLCAPDAPPTAGSPTRQAQPLLPTLPPLSILLAEDSDFNTFVIKAYLKNTSCRLDFARTGKEAVEKFKQNQYDLVLMDIQMPVMDGYEATAAIRSFESTTGRRAAPILALTANALAEDERKSLDAGCNAHLAKPVNKEDLFAALLQHGVPGKGGGGA